MSAVWQEELGDGANEEGLAERPFHPFQEGGLTFVAVDDDGRPELLCYLPLSRLGWPGCLASDRAATELRRWAAISGFILAILGKRS
jgi:hypothetical protein